MNNTFFYDAIKILFTAATLSWITACGGGGDESQIPPGATVTVTPQEKTWDIQPQLDSNENCIFFEDFYQDELVLVTVQDSQGRAIGDADLLVSLNLSEQTFSGLTVMELYEDRDGDFIPSPEERVSDDNDPLLMTKTDEFSGSVNLIVRMNLSCTYRGTLMVVAEGVSGSAEFAVREQTN